VLNVCQTTHYLLSNAINICDQNILHTNAERLNVHLIEHLPNIERNLMQETRLRILEYSAHMILSVPYTLN